MCKECWTHTSPERESFPLNSLISGFLLLLFLLKRPTWASCHWPHISWQLEPLPVLAMGSGLHMLDNFCSWPWSAWWSACRAVLSPGSSGSRWLSFPLCQLSQFLTRSHSELLSLCLAAACFPACPVSSWEPLPWLSGYLRAHSETVWRGFA